MSKFTNKLSEADVEMLALLAEECGEVIQVVGKILRHGFDSHNPLCEGLDNRGLLEKELGHVGLAESFLANSRNISMENVGAHFCAKRSSIQKWLHHQ